MGGTQALTPKSSNIAGGISKLPNRPQADLDADEDDMTMVDTRWSKSHV